MANKITLFAKELKARLTGNESEKIAAQNERKANSAVNGQLAALKAKQVDDETAVEEAQDAYNNAKYPTTRIFDNKEYIKDIVYFKDRLDRAKGSLADTKESIAFWEEFLKDEWAQVDAAEAGE